MLYPATVEIRSEQPAIGAYRQKRRSTEQQTLWMRSDRVRRLDALTIKTSRNTFVARCMLHACIAQRLLKQTQCFLNYLSGCEDVEWMGINYSG